MKKNKLEAAPDVSIKPLTPPLFSETRLKYPLPRKRRKKRKGNRLPPFVAMAWDLLNSKAYIQFNNAARVALIYFIGKPHMIYDSPDYYDTDFSFPYSEAKRLGFPSGTFFKVINELVRHGFLDPVRKGGCYGDLKLSNSFRLSRRWQRYGCSDFKLSDWAGFIHKPRKNGDTHGYI